MSSRAAWRLERLGYSVYDYAAGKADWTAAGLETVRAGNASPTVIDDIERDVPTLPPDSPVRALQAAADGGVPFWIVVNEQRIVLGRVRASSLRDAPPDALAEQVMEPGPATVRADADLAETRDRLRRHGVARILVTTPEGELLGVFSADADRNG